MQKPLEKTGRMLLVSSENEIFEVLVKKDHPFRKLTEIFNWTELVEPFTEVFSHTGTPGRNLEQGIKALLVQFWEDYSDREMESAIRENVAVRWFCGYGLLEDTPDHTYFSKLRTRLGTKRIATLFNNINSILETKGLFGNVFTFIDASAIVTKTALWEERDRAIADGAEKLNNANVSNYASDPDARWGAKSKKKIWYGYKRHEAVDMRHGLVRKVAVTPANVPDFAMTGNIAPKSGAVFSDKLYDTKKNDTLLKSLNLHPATIRKNTNKLKIRGLDNWRSSIRMPFEGTFSKRRKRTKFRTLVKVTMQCFLEALVHNLKKAVRFILPIPV
jgi:IS5 family transposase